MSMNVRTLPSPGDDSDGPFVDDPGAIAAAIAASMKHGGVCDGSDGQ
jgi:hypothetical protein